jgi:hypothetical protein
MCYTQYPRNWSLTGEGDDISIPSDDHRGVLDRKKEFPLKIKSISADQGTPSKGTWPDKRERAKEGGIDTDPFPNEKKERTREFTRGRACARAHTHTHTL